jgi:biotin carboxyl carrier protein
MGIQKKKYREIKVLKAPMPGLIIEINVSEGQAVKKDEPLLILKAMKMENILRSPIDGVISKILVQQNQKIEKETAILQF